jgi:DNA-binding transcriptional regulator GbsR (MarR family)
VSVDDFVERFALWFEQSGVPRMSGRVLAWLLVCDPPHQSAEDLAEGLQASRGSISTTVRALAATELVERVTFPGDRRTYYRARSDWSSMLEAQLKRVIELRGLTEEGLDVLAEHPAERRERLEGVRRFAALWEDELTELIDRQGSS